MDKQIWSKIRRKLAIIMTFILVGTLISNNYVPLEASGNILYIDEFGVVDESGDSVSGGDVWIGDNTVSSGESFKLDKDGKLILTNGITVTGSDVSGNEYLEVSGSDYQVSAAGYESKSGTFESGTAGKIVLKKIYSLEVTVQRRDGATAIENAEIRLKKDGFTVSDNAIPLEDKVWKTAAGGKASVGFTGNGDYEISVSWNGMEQSVPVVLNDAEYDENQNKFVINYEIDFAQAVSLTVSSSDADTNQTLSPTYSIEVDGEIRDGFYDLEPGSQVTFSLEDLTDYHVESVKLIDSADIQTLTAVRVDNTSSIYEFILNEDTRIDIIYNKKSDWEIIVKDGESSVTQVTAGAFKRYVVEISGVKGNYDIGAPTVSGNSGATVEAVEDKYFLQIPVDIYDVNGNNTLTITCDIVRKVNGGSESYITLSKELEITQPETEYGSDVYFIDKDENAFEESELSKFRQICGIAFPKSDKNLGYYRIYEMKYDENEEDYVQSNVKYKGAISDLDEVEIDGNNMNTCVDMADGRHALTLSVSENSSVETTALYFNVDNTAPEVDIKYYMGDEDGDGTLDVISDIWDGECFGDDITAVISINEANFNQNEVTIDFDGTQANNNNDIEHAYNENGWVQNGDEYQYSITFSTEGSYQLTASYTDEADNASNEVAASNFTVDKTAPVVSIIYNENRGNQHYNIDRIATVSVTDRNFDSAQTNFIIEPDGVDPEISAWSHSSGEECDEINHVNGCVWSSNVTFSQDGDYAFTFECTDKAGNTSNMPDVQEFTIDKTKPVINVTYDNNAVENGMYYKAGRVATIMVTEHNINKDSIEDLIKIQVTSPDGARINNHSEWQRVEDDVYSTTISYDVEGEYRFNISGSDPAGNDAEDYVEDNFVTDWTAPSDKVYIRFSGDVNKFYNDSGLPVTPVNEYDYGAQSGTLFNKNQVILEIFTMDLPDAQEISGAPSGIAEVKVTYTYTNNSNKSTKDKTTVVSFKEGSSDAVITRNAVVINGVSYDKIVLKFNVSEGQKITSLQSILVTDMAGNKCNAAYEGITEDQLDYVIDNISPELHVDIPSDRSSYSRDDNTYYYNHSVSNIMLTIAENNFYEEDIITVLKASEASTEAKMDSYQYAGSNRYTNRIALSQGDGIYRFSVSYTDRSGNQMKGAQGSNLTVTEDTYVSPLLVVDTTAPVMSIRYYLGGTDITSGILGGNCYRGDITAVISITEVNFDPELVTISFGGTSAENNGAIGHSYNKDGWSKNGNAYQYSITFSTEGSYQLTASCIDKAGNASNNVDRSSFTVDKSAPVVSISYNTTTENQHYNVNRIATVSIKDRNFDSGKTDFVVTTDGAQPEISSWSHSSGGGCSGSNHVNGCVWSSSVTFSQDADYSFTFECTDKAGSNSNKPEVQEFTIDKTNPVISVAYDNNAVENERYYNAARVAAITVTEHNFREDEIQIQVTSPDGQINSHSGWRNVRDDVYSTTISYHTDGEYTFSISGMDPAGNEAEAYAGDNFVIDLTPPELEILNVADRTPYKGVVSPTVSYTDKNYSVSDVSIRIEGVNNGEVKINSGTTAIDNGQRIDFEDFAHTQDMDDIYTLTAAIKDKAGNITEESIMFSVNRYGSNYYLLDDTKEVVEKFYINYMPTITVREVNVNSLKHKSITSSVDGDILILEEGVDYLVDESGSEYEWKEYIYHIKSDNFAHEGRYVLTIQSIDEAENDTNNRIKEKDIEFVVDMTAPIIIVGGLEAGERYQDESRSVTIDSSDNIYLTDVTIYLNESELVNYTEEELAEGNGVLEIVIGGAQKWQTMYVTAVDAAGNEAVSIPLRFLITSDWFVLWYNNLPLFVGSIVASVAVIGGAGTFVVTIKRKRKMKKD